MSGEDRQTRTVGGARAFERWRSMGDEQDADGLDVAVEHDGCRCSDPGCPCDGVKDGAA